MRSEEGLSECDDFATVLWRRVVERERMRRRERDMGVRVAIMCVYGLLGVCK